MDKAARAALLTAKGMDKTSENIADYVADLLRQGRAKEITDDLMEQADPQRLMQHYKNGNTGMDLPMDQASRMARAKGMGLTEKSYHGTGKSFPHFDPALGGTGAIRGNPIAKEGIFTSPMPEMADRYAEQGAGYQKYNEGGNNIPLMVKPATSSVPLQSAKPEDLQNAKQQGHASVNLNFKEDPWETVTFDPTNIRSQFARFDPRLEHLAHLSASTGGAMEFARARTAVIRAGGQIAPSKYLPDVPRQVHADGGRIGYGNGGMTEEEMKDYMAQYAPTDAGAELQATLNSVSKAGRIGKLAGRATGIPMAGFLGRQLGEAYAISRLNKEDGGSVTDSDEFRNWFGNSVTHTDGDPHVFYTGTSKDKDFTAFNVGRHGAWFTRDPAEASQYAEQNDSQGYKHEAGWKLTPTNTASRVIPAYVKAENPYTGDLPDEVLRSNYKTAQSDWFDTLRRKGHDAWVPSRYNGDLVVALKEPQQIKSIYNNGKFDPNQKHMGKAGGGEIDGVESNNQNGVMSNEIGTAPLNLAPRAQAGELRDAGGVRGGLGVLQAQNEASLEGLPTKVGIPLTGGSVSAGHDPRIRQIARDYMASTGLPYSPPKKYAKVDPKRASRIAAAYDEMKDNANDPLTKASYDAMIKETMAQYHAAKNAGFKAEFWNPDTEEDPYKASPRLATEDVRNNHHMWVYPTRSGYGSEGPITAKELEENPLLRDSGETWNGQPVTVNDIFRAVHDYYGHAKEGVGFRGDGEENAWRSHASMYSPLARMAMTSETRGQNSWVNYGPHGEKNRNAKTEDTIFAPQKVGILPHWAHHEGAEDFMGPEEVNAMAAIRKVHGRAPGGAVDDALALTRRFTKDGTGATMALKSKGK